MLHFLKSNMDMFVWKYRDMPSIDHRIITHKLNVNPKTRLVQQKKIKFTRKKNEVINMQGTMLKEKKIVREVDYLTWLLFEHKV